jgi:hypothetical protein
MDLQVLGPGPGGGGVGTGPGGGGVGTGPGGGGVGTGGVGGGGVGAMHDASHELCEGKRPLVPDAFVHWKEG